MKKVIAIFIILAGFNISLSGYEIVGYSAKGPSFTDQMQTLVTFFKPLPEKVRLLEKVNFSFYVDQSVISQCRYMIQLPKGINPGIDEGLTRWSPWRFESNIEIKLQSFNKEVKFKFLIEYRQHTSAETKTFEKSIEVKWENPSIRETDFNVNNQNINTGSPEEKLKRTSDEYNSQYLVWQKKFAESCSKLGINKQSAELIVSRISETIIKSSKEVIIRDAGKYLKAGSLLSSQTIFEMIQKGNSDLISVYRDNDANLNATMASVSKAVSVISLEEFKLLQSSALKPEASGKGVVVAEATEIKVVIENQKKEPVVQNKNDITSKNIVTVENVTDYNKLLKEAITKRDGPLVKTCIDNNADVNIKSDNGGTIFHSLTGIIEDESIISKLKSKGISLNSPDNFGNTPLHYSVLRSESGYSKILLNQGADPGILNKNELSPLHLAVFLGQKETVTDLLKGGSIPDLQGKDGYNALLIASEMNQQDIAKSLLQSGANKKTETRQKLNSSAIARIQDNHDMVRLLKGNNKSTKSQTVNISSSPIVKNSLPYPQINFSLAYDNDLLKKRNTCRIIQFSAVPVFIAGSAGALYFRTKANSYYDSYKNAENIDDAQTNYDKMNKYDTYALISVTVSAGSLYAFIHSTIKKERITAKMRKTF